MPSDPSSALGRKQLGLWLCLMTCSIGAYTWHPQASGVIPDLPWTHFPPGVLVLQLDTRWTQKPLTGDAGKSAVPTAWAAATAHLALPMEARVIFVLTSARGGRPGIRLPFCR